MLMNIKSYFKRIQLLCSLCVLHACIRPILMLLKEVPNVIVKKTFLSFVCIFTVLDLLYVPVAVFAASFLPAYLSTDN